MSWTKRQIIIASLEEIGLASYVFDLTPDQLESALRRLDALMAMWNAEGIRLGYLLPTDQNASDLDQLSNIPDSALLATILNLAVQIAPSYGKNLSPETRIGAAQGYSAMLSSTISVPHEVQFPSTLPRGAGNRTYSGQSTYFPIPTEPLAVGPDNEFNFT